MAGSARQGGEGRVGSGVPHRRHLQNSLEGTRSLERAGKRHAAVGVVPVCSLRCDGDVRQADALHDAGIQAFPFDIDGNYEPLKGEALEALSRRCIPAESAK